MATNNSGRASTQPERRSASDDSRPRVSTSRAERPEQGSKRPRSPQPQPGAQSRRVVASTNAQKLSRGVDERKTERVKVTTRETVTSRTRSPQRRVPAPRGPPERVRTAETTASDGRGRGNVESPQSKLICDIKAKEQ